MKLLILSSKLKEGVNIVSRLAQKSINLPILSNILLQTKKNFLEISATDLEVGIKYWALAKIEKEGQLTVPGKTFSGLVNSLTDEQIALTGKNNVLSIEGKNFQSKILGQSAQDYPIIPEIKGEPLEVDLSSFSQALSLVADVTAPTKIRPELAGVYLSFNQDRILMAASDSFRLAEKKIIPGEGLSLKEKQELILPSKTAREIINIFGEKEGKVKIYFSPNQIMFETDLPEEAAHPQLQITSRLIEGSYPNYQEIIPQEFQTTLTLNREKFLEQIRTASLFCGKVNEVQLEVLPHKGELKIFSQNSELGENRSTLFPKIEGQELKVSFNYRFLLDALSKIRTSEVIFQLSGQEGPALLRPSGDETYFYVIMPIKPT